MKDLKDGIRSKVKIDFQGHVHKWFRGTDKDKRCANEARILRALEERGCPYVPKLLEHHPEDDYIVTTNCGQPAPGISREKSDALFDDLEQEYGVRHDDPEPRNVTYSPVLGRFCLIDFELAELVPLSEPDAPHAHRDIWKINWSSRTATGNRHIGNDDAYLALEVSPEGARRLDADGESLFEPNHLVLAVSDGMGGGAAGELASRLILARIRKRAPELYEALHANPDNAEPLIPLLRSAHEGLNALAANEDNLRGMGATLTLAWISPGCLSYAHIGDSRLYLHRAGNTTLLTEDQTRAFSQWKSGQITEVAFRSHPRRCALYDILGAGHDHIHPQIGSHALENEDRLLLCTDGIIDGLWERGIRSELSAAEPPRNIATRLLERARKECAADDATAIVAELEQL